MTPLLPLPRLMLKYMKRLPDMSTCWKKLTTGWGMSYHQMGEPKNTVSTSEMSGRGCSKVNCRSFSLSSNAPSTMSMYIGAYFSVIRSG